VPCSPSQGPRPCVWARTNTSSSYTHCKRPSRNQHRLSQLTYPQLQGHTPQRYCQTLAQIYQQQGQKSYPVWDTTWITSYHPTLSPKTVNGLSMTPLGRVPVTIQLGQAQYEDELHIYPGISGTLLSWRAAKALRILPPCYPHQMPQGQSSVPQKQLAQVQQPESLPAQRVDQNLMGQYPMVFDGQIRVMAGETFHITLVDNAVPFCVKAPRSIPFAYRDKLNRPALVPEHYCSCDRGNGLVCPNHGDSQIRPTASECASIYLVFLFFYFF